jgi:hypothetical protein
MIEKIKEIFTGHIGNSSELTSLLKKHPDIFEYCSDILLNEPAYEKVSYVIICIVKRINFN